MSTLQPPGRIGLAGAGAFGRFCLEAYAAAPDLAVVAVADPDPAALAQVGHDVRREREWQRLVEAPDIEAIHVVTPPYLRRPIVVAALEAGKSVFCEKPPALSLEELDEMLATAERHGVTFGVDYVMRQMPAYRFLADAGHTGLFGAPRTVSFVNLAQHVPPDHWFWDGTRSGGIFVEHGVHFFDAYSRVLGPAAAVSGSRPRPEAVSASIRYRDGALATFFHEFAYPQVVERTEAVIGWERGTMVLEGWIPTRLEGAVLSDAEALRALARDAGMDLHVAAPEDGVVWLAATFPDRQARYRDAIAAGMRDLLCCHRDRTRRPAVTPDEIRCGLLLALAAQRAAEDGSRVTLPSPAPSIV